MMACSTAFTNFFSETATHRILPERRAQERLALRHGQRQRRGERRWARVTMEYPGSKVVVAPYGLKHLSAFLRPASARSGASQREPIPDVGFVPVGHQDGLQCDHVVDQGVFGLVAFHSELH